MYKLDKQCFSILTGSSSLHFASRKSILLPIPALIGNATTDSQQYTARATVVCYF
jgi:hypothetical protein